MDFDKNHSIFYKVGQWLNVAIDKSKNEENAHSELNFGVIKNDKVFLNFVVQIRFFRIQSKINLKTKHHTFLFLEAINKIEPMNSCEKNGLKSF